jgi:hypothetical protein
MKNTLRKILFSIVFITISFYNITVFADTNVKISKSKVEQAVQNKTFYNYMMAYIDVLGLPDGEEKSKLLEELAPVYNTANTTVVQKSRELLDKVAKNKDGKTYAETESYIGNLSKNELDEYTKGYLLGELTSWGRQFVFTQDYIDALNGLYDVTQYKNAESYKKAINLINNVINPTSKSYLINELNNYKTYYNIKMESYEYDKSILGNINGSLNWIFNSILGDKPDNDSNLILIPVVENDNFKGDKSFSSAVALNYTASPNGLYNIYTTKSDSNGYYEFKNVPVGNYYLIMISKNSKGNGIISLENSEIITKLFNSTHDFFFKAQLGNTKRKLNIEKISILENDTITKDYNFGYTYVEPTK